MTHSSQDSVINRICRFKIYLNHAEELTIVPGTVWKWFRSWNNLKFWSHFQMSDIIRSFESNLDEKSSKSTRRFIQFQIKSVVSSWLNFSSSHSTQLNMVLEWGLEARKKNPMGQPIRGGTSLWKLTWAWPRSRNHNSSSVKSCRISSNLSCQLYFCEFFLNSVASPVVSVATGNSSHGSGSLNLS